MATVPIILDPLVARVGTTAIPELVTIAGADEPQWGYAFDAAAREDIYFTFPAVLYGSGNVAVTVQWYSRSGSTTGDVIWGARLKAITSGDAVSVEGKTFSTSATTTTTVNGTAKGLKTTVITITSLDSLAADDKLSINVYRDAAAGGDTMAGDAIYVTGTASYSDT